MDKGNFLHKINANKLSSHPSDVPCISLDQTATSQEQVLLPIKAEQHVQTYVHVHQCDGRACGHDKIYLFKFENKLF